MSLIYTKDLTIITAINFTIRINISEQLLKMAQNVITPNLGNLNISNVTNKQCHMCLKEFSSVPELHEHIDNDHDFRHPLVGSQSNFISDSQTGSSQNSKQQPKK